MKKAELTREHLDGVWRQLDDSVAGGEYVPQIALGLVQWLVEVDPEGAARRASAAPQYDHARAQGGEHEPVPDGGGDSGKPHPELYALANDCS